MTRTTACTWVAALLFGAAVWAAEKATAKAEGAPIYARQRVVSKEIVRTLKRGETVVIEYSVASGTGEWCAVNDESGKGLGYMRGEDLDRKPVDHSVVQPLTAAAPVAPVAAPVAQPAARPVSPRMTPQQAGDDFVYPLQQWVSAFRFNEGQRAKVEQMAYGSGLGVCRQQFEDHYRRFEEDMAGPGNLPEAEYQRRVSLMLTNLNRFAPACKAKLIGVLERFPELMTTDQRANAALTGELRNWTTRERKAMNGPGPGNP